MAMAEHRVPKLPSAVMPAMSHVIVRPIATTEITSVPALQSIGTALVPRRETCLGVRKRIPSRCKEVSWTYIPISMSETLTMSRIALDKDPVTASTVHAELTVV